MDIRTSKLTNLFLMVFLALVLIATTLAEAGRGHRGHGHHHGHHHKHHHHEGYRFAYSDTRCYYQPYYPQARYDYYNHYYPVPVYVPPPQLMMGIGSRNMDFMIRF